MAITGLSLTDQNWYVCRADPGKRDTLEESRDAGATIFFFRTIPNKLMSRIHDMQSSASVSMGEQTTQTFHQKVAGKNREAFRYGVSSWENFNDDNDKAIPLEFHNEMEGLQTLAAISETSMNQVRLQTVNEVGAHIFNINTLGDEERKKFEALLSHLDGSENGTAESVTTVLGENGDVTAQPITSDEKKISKPRRTKKPAK